MSLAGQLEPWVATFLGLRGLPELLVIGFNCLASLVMVIIIVAVVVLVSGKRQDDDQR